MLDQYSVEQKLLGANVLLFIVITVAGVAMMVHRPEIPADPPLDELRGMLSDISLEVRTDPNRNASDEFTKFGNAPIFETLILLPTPSPTPEPTPEPPPSLKDAILAWKVKAIAGTLVIVEDPRTRDEFVMDLTKKDEPKITRYRNIEMPIYLDSIDSQNYKATFKYTSSQGAQTVTKGMFDE